MINNLKFLEAVRRLGVRLSGVEAFSEHKSPSTPLRMTLIYMIFILF